MVARKIAVITGSRADYGHLRTLLSLIKSDADLELQVVACGQHLSDQFGQTWQEIERDGFTIAAKVDLELPVDDDSKRAIAEASGRGVARMSAALAELQPDIVVVLGDRFEILAAGLAAFILGTPVAHIHGGEVTEAAMDEGLRHALTKLSALHFTAAPAYAYRVIQMGEPPERVHMVGAPGLDHALEVANVSREALRAELGLPLDPDCPFILVTWHPVTLEEMGTVETTALLASLDNYPEASILFTGVNSDPGHLQIAEAVQGFVAADPVHRVGVRNLPQDIYLSAMKLADVFVGNSSSGLIEAPALGTPSVNVGQRQAGRLRASSVIDSFPAVPPVLSALKKALDPANRDELFSKPPPYGAGGASEAIVEVLKSADLAALKIKKFHDL